MEKEKPLPWSAFVGCVLAMASLFMVFAVNIYLSNQSSDIYRSRPLANVAGLTLLILGIILTYAGFRKAE